MWKLIWRGRKAWGLLQRDGRLLWRAFTHRACPWWFRLGVLLALAYLLSPIDLVPDWLLFFGWLDDILLLNWGLRALYRRLPEALRLGLEPAVV